MSAKIYQIFLDANASASEGQGRGFLERKAEQFKALPFGTKLVVGTAAVAATMIGAPVELAVGVFAVGSAITYFTSGRNGQSDNNVVLIRNPADLKKFSPYEDDEFVNGAFYVQHPKKPALLIPSAEFHKSIIVDQMHEIIQFLRSELLVTRIKIEAARSKRLNGGAQVEKAGLDARASFADTRTLVVSCTYNNPVLVSLEKPLLWMDRFKVIRSSVRNATGGSSVFVEAQDMSFGLNVNLAKYVGIEANWLSEFSFTVEVDYG
jgi:hypothetical protein